MNFKGAAPKRTLCEVLREINDIISDPKEGINQETITRIRARMIDIEGMAKKMSIKLRQYNQRYDKDWWEQNKNYLKDIKRRESMSFLDKEPE